jgi:hypothetical protein
LKFFEKKKAAWRYHTAFARCQAILFLQDLLSVDDDLSNRTGFVGYPILSCFYQTTHQRTADMHLPTADQIRPDGGSHIIHARYVKYFSEIFFN